MSAAQSATVQKSQNLGKMVTESNIFILVFQSVKLKHSCLIIITKPMHTE